MQYKQISYCNYVHDAAYFHMHVITEEANKFASFFITTLFITTLKNAHHWIPP
jgi:hypothetical protein